MRKKEKARGAIFIRIPSGRLCARRREVLSNLPSATTVHAKQFTQGSYPFLNKKFKDFSRTFKDTFPIFQGLYSIQKEP